jgi:BirA family biotin operon repressor/biotin-[acetyl-CoA-carboxylase] ligase
MAIGSKIIFIPELTSTNTYAINLANTESPEDGTVIRAAFQSAGKGQPGNGWESEAGKNLLISTILYPKQIKPDEQFIVSIALSLGIHDFLSEMFEECTIKWPNDIYIGSDKIAGMLIESSVMGDSIAFMIAGIGLNVNQEKFTGPAPNPVSMKILSGKDYDTDECLGDLLKCLDSRYNTITERTDKNLTGEYLSRLYRYNQWSFFRDAAGKFKGRIAGVSPDGRIKIEKESGVLNQYYFKEVEFIL